MTDYFRTRQPMKKWALAAPTIHPEWKPGADEILTDRVLAWNDFELHFMGTVDQTRQWLRDAADNLNVEAEGGTK